MPHLIDKDALVAEIERRIEHNTEWKDACKTLAVLAANQAVEEDNKILSIINTLEVKEVDLEKTIEAPDKNKNKIVDILFDFYDEYQSNEINRPMIPSIYADKILDSLKVKEIDLEKELANWRHNHFHGKRDDEGAAGEWLERTTQLDLAKYFFELGLKAQKGEGR